MIHLILLSGGSGTRLWPLSNNARSKQFLKVLRDEHGNHISMVQRVFGQISQIDADLDVTIATTEAQRYSIESQLPEGGYSLVIEPERRDTAPAIMLACKHLESEQGAGPADTVVVMPIDTFADQEYYDRVADLDAVVQEGVADLVLMGVEPTYPSEKYGYIVPGPGPADDAQVVPASDPAALAPDRGGLPVGAASRAARHAAPVSRFVEKPSEPEAERLIAEGALWNCGVFAFRLGYLLGIAGRYSDAADYADLRARYADLPKSSFDYELVERAGSVAVVPYAGTWKDLGTWNTLTEHMAAAASGRVIGVNSTCENVHVVNETGLPMVVTGLQDAVVVATRDGILVADKAQSSHMKPLVERIAESRPMYEQRRWGEYRVIDTGAYPGGKRSLTKELVIAVGRQLSYQRHAHRAEVWTVASGEGEVVLDGGVRAVAPGDIIDIHPMQKHAARAKSELHIIEVQLGDLLEEEDIEHFGDYWPVEIEGVA